MVSPGASLSQGHQAAHRVNPAGVRAHLLSEETGWGRSGVYLGLRGEAV